MTQNWSKEVGSTASMSNSLALQSDKVQSPAAAASS